MRERTLSEALNAAVAEKLAFIAANREALIEAFVAQHGFNPDEAVLVTQDAFEDGKSTTRCWIERRVSPPVLPLPAIVALTTHGIAHLTTHSFRNSAHTVCGLIHVPVVTFASECRNGRPCPECFGAPRRA
jgi:hypothetical protein